MQFFSSAHRREETALRVIILTTIVSFWPVKSSHSDHGSCLVTLTHGTSLMALPIDARPFCKMPNGILLMQDISGMSWTTSPPRTRPLHQKANGAGTKSWRNWSAYLCQKGSWFDHTRKHRGPKSHLSSRSSRSSTGMLLPMVKCRQRSALSASPPGPSRSLRSTMNLEDRPSNEQHSNGVSVSLSKKFFLAIRTASPISTMMPSTAINGNPPPSWQILDDYSEGHWHVEATYNRSRSNELGERTAVTRTSVLCVVILESSSQEWW